MHERCRCTIAGFPAVRAVCHIRAAAGCRRPYGRCGTTPAPTFAADLGAGVTVGLVALPLAMAFAIASGLSPEAGIYCAIVTGFLISAFGGSRFQIGGPTGAFVVVIAGIVQHLRHRRPVHVHDDGRRHARHPGPDRDGHGGQVPSPPVVIGFTNGIAVLIASTQIRDFFGLQIAAMPSEFAERMEVLARARRHALDRRDRVRRHRARPA